MTPTMEEVAGWLREDAEHFRLIGEGLIKGKALCAYAAQSESRASQVETMGWRPISEAPRDGTLIDLWESNTKERLPDCMWCKGTWRQFQHPDEEWVDVMYGTITHFMPLPQPPVKK